MEMLPTNSKATDNVDSRSSIASPLVSSCQHLLQPNGSILGRHVAATILPLFPSMCSAIPAELGAGRTPALASIDGRQPITLTRIRDFILSEFGPQLHSFGFGRQHRIAVVLPNGPELALAIVAISNWASCVPLNASGAKSEMEADLERCGADLVIGPSLVRLAAKMMSHKGETNVFNVMPDGGGQQFAGFSHVEETANRLGIPFVGLVPSTNEAGLFRLVRPSSGGNMSAGPRRKLQNEADTAGGTQRLDSKDENVKRFSANSHDDEVLVLFTSGTTGNKKIVPHRLGDMLVAAATIAVSWNLSPNDVNCNLMPLFHVGGIVRQVFAPILSGGCVICCPSFDPSTFWALLDRKAFTWYYAAPTMHQLILQERTETPGDSRPKLRMIANAAGGLLPSLARKLRDTFSANVLPSYGMTECMPISSPPFTYQLEKAGTSGVAVGPELEVLNLSTGKAMQRGKEGAICVRGEPCFRGYGVNHAELSHEVGSAFLEGGWFNTGDLGYMDEDGYLFITGRTKEVINRGGEIISPLEVEEAIVSHPDVKVCAAISTPHDVLQEVVGIVIVSEPDRPRINLQDLHNFLGEDRLAAPKWPQILVFMDGLPKSHTNKLLRVKLSRRLGLPEINDRMHSIERTFEAKCPAQGTSIRTAISCERVKVSAQDVEQVLRQFVVKDHGDRELYVVPHPSRVGSLVCHVYNIDRSEAISISQQRLHKYLVPSHFCLLAAPAVSSRRKYVAPAPADSVSAILQGQRPITVVDPMVTEIQELFRDLLDLDCLPAATSNFFNLGGSSMLASQLASKIRKRYGISFGGTEVFQHSSSELMANLVKSRKSDLSRSSKGPNLTSAESEQASSSQNANCTFAGRSSNNQGRQNVNIQQAPFVQERLAPKSSWCTGFVQLLPLFALFPLWQVSRFFLLFSCWLLTLKHVPGEKNMWTFVVTLVVFHIAWVVITPLVFVAIKWTIIGRYRKGRYPLWGSYYLRWWFVDVCRKFIGRGVWGSNSPLLNAYYRLLGAKIAPGARISISADIAEFDLVFVGNNAAIEYSTVRAFGLDCGSMILGPVSVGEGASVGYRSIVAPFTAVADGTHLGPAAASYEISRAEDQKYANVNRYTIPEPSLLTQFFVAGPISFFVDTISHLPALLVLWYMVSMPWHHEDKFTSMSDLLEWLCDLRRLPFYIGIRVARALVSPFVHMACAIVVKWSIIGKFRPGPRDTSSEWQLLRLWLAATLFSRENMQEVTELLGRHYELVSCLYRMLGAKVGQRVFWPGQQPYIGGTFDLLEIGDDVVFGSRSAIFCTSRDWCKKVTLCTGSNVSDNCVVLPGAIIGKNAVLGSSSVCPEDRYLPENSVYFGSAGGEPLCLEQGVGNGKPILSTDMRREELPLIGDDTTLRPFGKAFYNHEASFWVIPLPLIIAFTFVARIFNALIHILPLIGALHATAILLYGLSVEARDYSGIAYSSFAIYSSLVVTFVVFHSIRVFICFGAELCAKWGFIGKREEGRYNWDTSTYAQNWELYQIVTTVRRMARVSLMDFIAGTPFMVEFLRLNGAKIGRRCCLFPAGADPYMTEPDLVEIGDQCAVDRTAVVAHLNTRGNFELAKIVVEPHATLRAKSRIQAGVRMEAGSMLLERSLAMTGEVIDADSVWYGSPAAKLFTYSALSIRPSTSYAAPDTQTIPDTRYGEWV